MNSISQKTVKQTIEHFRLIAEYLKIPQNEAENQKLIELVRQLKNYSQKNTIAEILMNFILEHIEIYEKRTYTAKGLKPNELLAFLMEQHGLKQNDLPELGTQPHVSKILSGKRQLTSEQISALSKRFHVSPSIFYDLE